MAAPQPDPATWADFIYSPEVDPTSERVCGRAGHRRPRPQDHGRPPQRVPARRDGARRAHRGLRRGRRRRLARGGARRGQGQGRRLQGHPRPAAALRLAPGVQLAAGRGEHRRPRRRDGASGAQAGGRDPVPRLHLAGLHADPGRAVQHPLALRGAVVGPGRGAGAVRRLPQGRRSVPLPVGRGALHPHSGAARRHALERARCQRPAAHRDPLRRPGDLPGAQAPLPSDAQQGPVPRSRLHGPVRQGRHGAGGERPHGDHLRGDGRPLGPGGQAAGGLEAAARSKSSTCEASRRTTGRPSRRP